MMSVTESRHEARNMARRQQKHKDSEIRGT